MPDVRQSVLATEFIKVPIRSVLHGQSYDPTGDVVELAFVAPRHKPAGGDWITGSWETSFQPPEALYDARALIGPNGHPLAIGSYSIWVRITDNPETPVVVAPNLLVIF